MADGSVKTALRPVILFHFHSSGGGSETVGMKEDGIRLTRGWLRIAFEKQFHFE